jgi:hypothetical protein
MDYALMADDDIIKNMAQQFEKLRITKQIKETEIEESAGISRRTLYNFRQGTTAITLKSFIRLLRGIGELDRLQTLLTDSKQYSPLAGLEKELPKRVRDRGNRDKGFKWGDEE